MATNAADPMEQDTEFRTATLQRKRAHDVVSCDDASNAGSAHSTPRKRARHAEKVGHQNVRDFVPAGASFSTGVVPVDETLDGDDDGSQAGISPKAETLGEYEVSNVSESDIAEWEKALVEGRRLIIRNLPLDTTEKDIKQFFRGYPIENLWLPNLIGDSSQLVTIAQNENYFLDGQSPMTEPSEEAATIGSTNYGRRLENVTIHVNPRTRRPVAYAFVTVSTSSEADRAISQLSGNQILERKVSIQRARAGETQAPDPGTVRAEEEAQTARSKHLEGYHNDGSVRVQEGTEENNKLSESFETTSPQDPKAALPVNWNAVNTRKIRTTLGGSVSKVKNSVDELNLANGSRKEAENNRDLATKVALERVEGLRVRLSAMDPHDGPVSAYKSAQQELHDAEVDYNYCLYFPVDEAFQPAPVSTERESTPKRRASRERRFRMWSMIEKCMKQGTLQDLKEGRIRVNSAGCLGQPLPAQKTSLESSGGLEQNDDRRENQMSTVTDCEQIRILEIEETTRKRSGYLKAFPKMEPGSNNYEKMKKRIYDTTIHLNYCQFFPVGEDYLPLALAKKGLNEFNSPKLDGIRATKRRAAQIWILVDQCTQDGNLQDLQEGRLAAWLKDAPPPNQSFFASARHPQELAVRTGHISNSQDGGGPKEACKCNASAASANVKPITMEGSNSHERQGTSEGDGGVILNLDYGNRDLRSRLEIKDGKQVMISANKDGQPVIDKNSGSIDEDMPSDVDHKGIKQELPAMNEVDDLYASDSGTASNSDTESDDSSTDNEGQSDDGDAMMQYSNSEQIAADEAERNKKTIAVPSSHKARILADLSSHDLNAQLRYFHTTRAREEIDGKTPVRCLVCAKEGHMAGLCESLTCSTCGAFNQHTTQACPNNVKCGKCREQGHDESRCPYKLKRMPWYEIVCDLCQRNGHIEQDCELIWRTSGRPWESDLAHTNVRLSCYECGRSGHLGNDCPSRKPKKSMGTSSWDGKMGPVSIKSTREIKIKGKATQQDPVNLDDSDDDRAKFFGPKISVPEPVRKGQIRIVTGRRESPEYEFTRDSRQAYADHRHGSFTSVDESYRDDQARQPFQQYRDRGRGSWRAGDGPDYVTDHNDLRHKSYRPNERRSRSPPYRDHGGYVGRSSWLPPRPAPRVQQQDRRPPVDANVYRPLRSATGNAWLRRRV